MRHPPKGRSGRGLVLALRLGGGGSVGLLAIVLLAGIASSDRAQAAPAAGHSTAPPSEERAFLDGNDAAMARMMAGMAIQPTGDIDRDFVAMMTPHHQGAIDMAVLVLRYGHNPQVRRLAQEIIVEQQQEIAAMKLAVGDPPPPSAPAPTLPSSNRNPMPGMGMR